MKEVNHFNLNTDMGSGGKGNLFRFVKFLKKEVYWKTYSINSYDYDDTEKLYEKHIIHPYYLLSKAEPSEWLKDLFDGIQPDEWLDKPFLEEIKKINLSRFSGIEEDIHNSV